MSMQNYSDYANVSNDEEAGGSSQMPLIDFIFIYLCSFLVVVGLIGNIISLVIFIRSCSQTPKIITRHSLLLLTLSNTIYLILFWYYKVLPKIVNAYLANSSLSSVYLVDSNTFMCKSIIYSINVAISLNASITVSFSLERAFVINFPYLAINLRENYRPQFKLLIVLIILFSFLLPSYCLGLLEIINHPGGQMKCAVHEDYRSLYFKLTVFFVINTLALPFLIISISNISIILEIYRNRASQRRIYKGRAKAGPTKKCWYAALLKKGSSNKLVLADTYHEEASIPINPINVSAAGARASTPAPDVNDFITKMLITISASFVLLNFPYFMAWCFHTIRSLDTKPNVPLIEHYERLGRLKLVVQLTEILILLNYSIAGLLYFASGKMFREHLFALFGCNFKRKKLSLSRVI